VVQVAACTDRADADERAADLSRDGFPVLTDTLTPAVGPPLNRVLVGPYRDRKDADAAAIRLEERGSPGYVHSYAPPAAAVPEAPPPLPEAAASVLLPAPEPATAPSREAPAETPVEGPSQMAANQISSDVVIAPQFGLPAALAPAQMPAQAHAYGQVSLFGYGSRLSGGDLASPATRSDVYATVQARSSPNDDGGFEFGLDMRGLAASSSGADTTNRLYLYDAFVGARSNGGTLGIRAGQMWLNDLGGLGALGGVLLEYRPPAWGSFGRPRFGLLGGLEPKILDVGYVEDVRKYGAYLAIDGEGTRRHVLGYVMVRNGSLTERSVLTISNFIPISQKFFLYQAAEYDITPPAGVGKTGFNYVFVTARYAPSRLIEFQATYHRGLSIDTRTITDDIRNGRPVDPRSVQGFLFEAAGGRVTLEPIRNFRIFGGYEADRNNQNDRLSNRYSGGFYYFNGLNTGFDISATIFHTESPNGMAGSYDSYFASIGKNFGNTVYLTFDYSSSLTILQLTPGGGVQVQNLPRSRRASLTGLIHLSRHVSVLAAGDTTWQGDTTETRLTLGLTYRF
jgi:hypothetical protein